VGSTNKHVTVAPGCGSVPPKRRAAFIVRISYRALRGTKAACPSRSAEWRRVDWWREKGFATDARGAVAALTKTGRDAIARASPVQSAGVRKWFISALVPE